MTKSTITRERLAKIKSWRETYGAGSNVMLPAEEAEELACLALAAIDSKPFAYIIQDKYERERGVEGHLSRSHVSKYVSQEDINEHEITCIPLYRHAQPVVEIEPVAEVLSNRPGNDTSTIDVALPVGAQLYLHAQPEPVVPDAMEPTIEAIKRILPTSNPDEYAVCIGADMWNACRAAMLQAEPVCTCPSGNGSLRWPCPVHPGSSPAIPEGYMMVPKEPTKEMINAGWLYYMGTKNPSSKGTYKAMLAAARQEGK
ncbi:hypothetical protein MLJ30_002128 [Klebsiella quasipneumoniae]|nr:hypothetical protein [Klebsiella quasipneumoniae]